MHFSGESYSASETACCLFCSYHSMGTGLFVDSHIEIASSGSTTVLGYRGSMVVNKTIPAPHLYCHSSRPLLSCPSSWMLILCESGSVRCVMKVLYFSWRDQASTVLLHMLVHARSASSSWLFLIPHLSFVRLLDLTVQRHSRLLWGMCTCWPQQMQNGCDNSCFLRSTNLTMESSPALQQKCQSLLEETPTLPDHPLLFHQA